MDNLIFSLNATLPIFFTMILGWFFRRVGLMDAPFVTKMNKFVFHAALPVLVFQDLATVDFLEVWDLRFVAFCFLATLASFFSLEGQKHSGRIHTGILPQQRSHSRYCLYSEYLWKCRDGSADDHCHSAFI